MNLDEDSFRGIEEVMDIVARPQLRTRSLGFDEKCLVADIEHEVAAAGHPSFFIPFELGRSNLFEGFEAQLPRSDRE